MLGSQSEPPRDEFDAANSELANALRRSFGVLKLIMFVLVVLYFLSGWFAVGPGERAVVYRFGDIVNRGSTRCRQICPPCWPARACRTRPPRATRR